MIEMIMQYEVPPVFNYVDVGCNRGEFLQYVTEQLELRKYPGKLFSIGIDPIWCATNYPSRRIRRKLWLSRYSVVQEVAIDDADEHIGTIHRYKDDDGCSSLLVANQNHGWNLGWEMKEKGTKDVRVLRLSKLLDELQFRDRIHYLKIDVQGKDVAVVKSLGPYLDRVMMIQTEIIRPIVNPLYVGQPAFDVDIIDMEKLGFIPMALAKRSYEYDMVFLNRKYQK